MHTALIAIITMLAVTFSASAAVIRVKQGVTGGNGSSWTLAYGDLQTAIGNSAANDEIWVAAGTYKPGTNQTDSFQLKRRVKMYGGFEGVVNETALSHRKPEVNRTILSGDINNNNTADAGDCIHVIRAQSASSAAEIDRDTQLDGFVIKHGYADGSSNLDNFGGGLLIAYASPVVQNCVFIKNHCASTGGGGAHVHSEPSPSEPTPLPVANPTFRACRFLNNTSDGEAGAACSALKSTVEFINCVFSGNHADQDGGALYNSDFNSVMTVINCTFYANSAGGQGGGIRNFQ